MNLVPVNWVPMDTTVENGRVNEFSGERGPVNLVRANPASNELLLVNLVPMEKVSGEP